MTIEGVGRMPAVQTEQMPLSERAAVEKYLALAKDRLGFGRTANVITRSEDSFCVKVFRKEFVADSEKEDLVREYAIQEKAHQSGARVPKPLGQHYFRGANDYLIYMEKIGGHSLDRYIRNEMPLPHGFDKEAFWKNVEAEVARLHAAGIIHGDLSNSENIMLDEAADGAAVIIDFGESRDARLKEGQQLSEMAIQEDLDALGIVRAQFFAPDN